MEVVRAIRNLRAENNVKPGRRIPAILVSANWQTVLRQQANTIAALAHLDIKTLQIVPAIESKPEGHIALVVGPIEIYLPLTGMVDVQEEKNRLEKELERVDSRSQDLEKLLSGPFAEKAPASVVQKEREKLIGLRESADKLRVQLRVFSG